MVVVVNSVVIVVVTSVVEMVSEEVVLIGSTGLLQPDKTSVKNSKVAKQVSILFMIGSMPFLSLY
jgi:hypothetical protein